MMSIRGLIFDDPSGTQGIEFSTMLFQNPDREADGDDSLSIDIEPEHRIFANNVWKKVRGFIITSPSYP